MDYKGILQSLGYRLQDNGDSWRACAVYRGGKNQNSLSIFKDSGIWVDFARGDQYMPFSLLVEMTAGKDSDIAKQVNSKKVTLGAIEESYIRREKDGPKMEKTYSPECLERLLPHYRFFEDKGYSKRTLSFYRGGLAMSGNSMNNRFVFPIFNSEGLIHGFNGRTVKTNDTRAKWKLKGKKQNFVYPAYLMDKDGEYPIIEAIEKASEVLVVESIGDSLRAFENGRQNNIVNFGVSLSESVKCFLNRFSNLTVIIGTNNDSDGGGKNAGLISAVKTYMELTMIYDVDSVKICLPVKNDFGDMECPQDWKNWEEKLKKVKSSDQLPSVLTMAEKMLRDGHIPQKYKKHIKRLKNV